MLRFVLSCCCLILLLLLPYPACAADALYWLRDGGGRGSRMLLCCRPWSFFILRSRPRSTSLSSLFFPPQRSSTALNQLRIVAAFFFLQTRQASALISLPLSLPPSPPPGPPPLPPPPLLLLLHRPLATHRRGCIHAHRSIPRPSHGAFLGGGDADAAYLWFQDIG